MHIQTLLNQCLSWTFGSVLRHFDGPSHADWGGQELPPETTGYRRPIEKSITALPTLGPERTKPRPPARDLGF